MKKEDFYLVQAWWEKMNPDTQDKKTRYPTAYRAQLRRCNSADTALMTDGFRALWVTLPEDITENAKPQALECWAAIAAIIVYVKKLSNNDIATAAGTIDDNNKPIVSELRFRQLQSAKTPTEFVQRLRRMLQQLDGVVSVKLLASDIHQWFFEYYSVHKPTVDRRIAVRWAMNYYRAATAASNKK